MKKIFTLFPTLLFFFFVGGQPKKPLKIEVFRQGETHSTEFTSNRFSAINISKDGIVWAGTIYEGLYRYDTKSADPDKSWKKSTVARNLFINDIKPDKFGGIWVAQSGNKNPGGSHIEGGVNHIPDAQRDSVVFYSITGTQTEGYFYSRNLVSLFITDSNRTDPRALPTDPAESIIFAAQGLSRMSAGGDVIRGGMNTSVLYGDYTNFYRNAGKAFFAIVGAPYEKSGWDCTSTGIISPVQITTPYAECVGGGSKTEVWVAVRDNYGMTEIVRYFPDGTPKGRLASYNHTNSALSQFSQPRAIHFDMAGNRWITTRNDGLVVLGSSGWAQVKLAGKLPAGTVFNRNAIAEDRWGNMYFGTNAGLLVYKSEKYNISYGPGNNASYDLFTAEDGLPGNNVTGVAYDRNKGQILLAVDGGGVAFLDVKPDNIEGVVFDVYTDILKKEKPSSTSFKRTPISNAASVKLILNGIEKESVKPDNEGYFKFTKDEPNQNYTVEVNYTTRDNKSMKYIYSNIESQSKVPPALFPDSLIGEIKTFKDSLAKKCTEYKILSVLTFPMCHDGFLLDKYEDPFAPFFDPLGVKKDQEKMVDNLGIYLASLRTVYDLGFNGTELLVQGMDNGWSITKAIRSMASLTKSLEGFKAGDASGIVTSPELQKAMIDALLQTAKASKEAFAGSLRAASVILSPIDEIQPTIKLVTGSLNDALDAVFDLIDKYRAISGAEWNKAGAKDVLQEVIDLMSKVITAEVGGQWYKYLYARGIHKQTIPQASAASVDSKSDLSYSDVNFALVAPNGESSLAKGKESLDFYKEIVADLNAVSKGSEMASSATVLFQTLLIVPGGQPVAAAAMVFSRTAKLLEIGAYAGAIVADLVGLARQVQFSKNVLPKSGINGLEASYVERKDKGEIRRDPPPPSQKQPVKLLESKNNYNEKVTALQVLAGTPGFIAADYVTRLNELRIADSLYSKESRNTFERLMASGDSAMIHIPVFEENLKYMMDSLVNRQPMYKYALYLNQFALLSDVDNKADYFPALDSTAKALKILNDSIYNNFVRMIDLINENGIEAPAYLSQTDYTMEHEFVPGTPGVFTNTYTNFGTEVMKNVSFKINQPTDGFNITSTDSIFVGDIAPQASLQVSFNFSSPAYTDSITVGRYTIEVKAENGKYNNTSGNLIIISRSILPVTLINFQVNCSGTNTQLSWETTSESNSSHFEIEKSSNGVDWTIVRRITTAGNSEVRRLYQLVDQASENSFYRLKHVDKDGQFTYSTVLRSKCSINRPLISVYPVPAKDVVNVVTIVTKASIARVVLLDIAGREVRRMDAALQPGDNIIRIKTSDLSSGHYILRFDGAEIKKTVKITINK